LSDAPPLEKTLDLAHKISFRGKEYSSVTAKPPRIGQRRVAEAVYNQGAGPYYDNLFANTLGMLCIDLVDAQDFADQMTSDQFEELYDWVKSFLPNGTRCTGVLAGNSLTLRTPIAFKGTTYKEALFTEPMVKHKRQMLGHIRTKDSPMNFTQASCVCVGFCTGLPPEVVDQIDCDQFEAGWNWITPFLTPGPRTGSS
jgi:hypothetical protein